MAEIKSTMEKVMERLATMGETPGGELEAEEKKRAGMRLAADFLRGEEQDLAQALESRQKEAQPLVLQGMVATLLRNVVLPRREDQQESAEAALQGLLQLSRGGGDLLPVFQEMQGLVNRYLEHRQQLKDQLRAAFAQQMEQLEQGLAQQTGTAMKVDPSQHPKFQEEWQRLQEELNSQYGRALDQHKALLKQRLVR